MHRLALPFVSWNSKLRGAMDGMGEQLREELEAVLELPPVPGEWAFGGRAESLPSALKLRVDGEGDFKAPLDEESAKTIIFRCSREAFGGGHCKRWKIDMKKVGILNPEWNDGMNKLCDTITHRLGYAENLELLPQQLAVHEAGAKTVTLDVAQEDDNVVAVLMVQPPSIHTGGAVRVFLEGECSYSCVLDFGGSTDAGRFAPHFAVFDTSARCELQAVTAGHRLMLMYAVRVPPGRARRRNPEMLKKLASKVEGVTSIVVHLANFYKDEEIEKQGWMALKREDRGRLCSLREANNQLTNTSLRLFLVRISNSTRPCDECEKEERFVSKWLALDGTNIPAEATTYNVLHYHPLFDHNNYTSCSRYAIVAWPTMFDAINFISFMGEHALLNCIREEHKRDGKTDFARVLDALGPILHRVSAEFHRGLAELLVLENNDFEASCYAAKFLWGIDPHAQGVAMIPVAITLLKAYPKAIIRKVVEWSFQNYVAELVWAKLSDFDEIQNSFVDVLESWFNGSADTDLRAQTVSLRFVWKLALQSFDFERFNKIVSAVRDSGIQWIKLSVDAIIDLNLKLTPERRKLIQTLVDTLVCSIENDINAAKNVETWEILGASFPADAQIEKFLRGPDEAMVLPSSSVSAAFPTADAWVTNQQVRQYALEGEVSLTSQQVTIRKTKKQLRVDMETIDKLEDELEKMRAAFPSSESKGQRKSVGHKRSRKEVEESA